MITAFGHGDLTPDALSRLETLFRQDLRRLPPGSTAVVRATAGVPVAFARAAHATGLRLLVVLPSEAGLPSRLPPADRDAATELLRLSKLTRLLPYAPEQRDACITADEHILATCRHALAVWDGSPSTRADATAHLVAYGRGRGVQVEGIWSGALLRRPPGRGEPSRAAAAGPATAAPLCGRIPHR